MLSILLSTWIYPAFSQNTEVGLIFSNSSNEFSTCCTYVPDNGFALYDRPRGEIVGRIEKGELDQNDEAYKLYMVKPQGGKEEIAYRDLKMVGYEIFALSFSDKRSGFVKVLDQYWIDEQEIRSSSLEAINYREFLIRQTDLGLSYYANPPGLNLREGPSTKYEIIKTLKGDIFQISPTKACEGLWCEVKVIEYKAHPCVTAQGEDENIMNRYEGWVKLLDDDGTPNVWYYAKGC